MSVRLRVAWGEFYAVSGMTFNWTALVVQLRNLALAKSVELHARQGSVWSVHPLGFKSHHGTYDLFGALDSGNILRCDEFAVRYEVTGKVFWDNNGGGNYHIATYSGAVGGGVALKQATTDLRSYGGGGSAAPTEYFHGDIHVANLGFQKRVGVVYSRDGGATWQTALASYVGPETGIASSISGVEVWRFVTPELNRDPSSPEFRFAVFYERRDPGPSFGVTHWDSCFGLDYRLPKIDNATLA